MIAVRDRGHRRLAELAAEASSETALVVKSGADVANDTLLRAVLRRGSARYRDTLAARRALPDAFQAADRWHKENASATFLDEWLFGAATTQPAIMRLKP
jgi:hypothetical protein